jgi:hypothetical protein
MIVGDDTVIIFSLKTYVNPDASSKAKRIINRALKAE